MVCNAWRKAWQDPNFAKAIDGNIWAHYSFLAQPYKIALDILEILAEVEEPTTYSAIGDRLNISPITVSQCLNCLKRAGYPIEYKSGRIRDRTGRRPASLWIGLAQEAG
jgi:HTH domain